MTVAWVEVRDGDVLAHLWVPRQPGGGRIVHTVRILSTTWLWDRASPSSLALPDYDVTVVPFPRVVSGWEGHAPPVR